MALHVIILAAGRGTRMRSQLPKVMHTLAGQPLLAHVVAAAQRLQCEKIHIVVGHGADQVQSAFAGQNIEWSSQLEQLGTAHAVAQALPRIPNDADVLVLYGDVPLINADTLALMTQTLNEQTMALLTVRLANPTGYGRILRNAGGDIEAIVEEKDASPTQRVINEVNTGVLALRASALHELMPRIGNNNAQGEYYLTDLIGLFVATGRRVEAVQPKHEQEVEGVNNRLQLAHLERWFQVQQAQALALNGVGIADLNRIDVRGELTTGTDCFLDVNCVFEGKVSLGNGVRIGPNCVLKNVDIGNDVVIEANSVLEQSSVANHCVIGPFARLRPGTRLSDHAKIGNFVETKNAEIREGAKVNHLSYVGDALVGAKTNIGAGTITCNYDGVNKFKTLLGENVFVGSNTALVAPVSVASGATIAAGSVITGDVGENQLAVARSRQKNIDNWKRPEKSK